MAFSIGNLFAFATQGPAQEREPRTQRTEQVSAALAANSSRFNEMRYEALSIAQLAAQKTGREASLAHYLIAMDQLAHQQRYADMPRDAHAFGNLSGLSRDAQGRGGIDGITISEKPPTEAELNAARADVRSAMEDSYNLDGDGRINVQSVDDFYNNIDFSGSDLGGARGVTFRPATSYSMVNGANVTNATFDELEAGQSVDLGSGTYDNIRFTNMNGGIINLAANGSASNMTLVGGHIAELNIGKGASLTNLQAQGTNIVDVSAAPGAKITNATFSNTTVSMASQLNNGVTLRQVTFNRANLNHVDMSNAHLSDVKFNDCNMTGMTLDGAVLDQVEFNNVDDANQRQQLFSALKRAARIGSKVSVDGQNVQLFMKQMQIQQQLHSHLPHGQSCDQQKHGNALSGLDQKLAELGKHVHTGTFKPHPAPTQAVAKQQIKQATAQPPKQEFNRVATDMMRAAEQSRAVTHELGRTLPHK